MYAVVTLNGKIFEFYADEMVELDGMYTFYLNDAIVAEFKKDAIAGYFILTLEDEDD